MTAPTDRFPCSRALLERARAVIPGGIWGHNRFPAFLDHGHYPYFARNGHGAVFEDVDGRRYIDYLCGYGAMISGHGNPLVDDAARAAMAGGDCLDLPTEESVALAEQVCATIAGADFCAFAKNGSDATWIACLMARAYTRRATLVCAEGAYHGSHAWCGWCNPGDGRWPADSAQVLRFSWNDLAALDELLRGHGDQVAAVMLTPFHHPIPGPAVMPEAGFFEGVLRLVRQHGALLILDDVRAGFRLDLRGSHVAVGADPDLVCHSKAVANGWPLSLVTGKAFLREAAASVFAAGTFWNAPSAMAAARTNLRLLGESGAIPAMARLGTLLCEGLAALGVRHGVPVRLTGPPAIPTMTIDGPAGNARMMRFARRMVARGHYLHPGHNWFLSAAHTEAQIRETLRQADAVLANLDDEGADA